MITHTLTETGITHIEAPIMTIHTEVPTGMIDHTQHTTRHITHAAHMTMLLSKRNTLLQLEEEL